MPAIAQRALDLGTENAFVVLAEVNALHSCRARHHVVLHRPARFPDAGEHPGCRRQGDPRRQARLHAVGRHRRVAEAVAADIPADRAASTVSPTTSWSARARSHSSATRSCPRPITVPATRSSIPTPDFRSTSRRSRPMARYRCRSACANRATSISIRRSSPTRSRRRTKLLILNSPQNPTGGIIPQQEMEAIAEILRKHEQVWVFADEIYGRLVYDGEFVSIATLPGMQERTIISDGAPRPGR